MVVAGQQNLAVANECFSRNERLSVKEQEQLTESMSIKRTVRQRSTVSALVKIGVVFLALIVINIIFQALLIQRNYEVRSLQGKMGDLKRQMVEMRIDMARLESFDRIQEIAQNKLGMKVAGTGDYRYIAAAPQTKSVNESYVKRAESAPKDNLWSKVNSWIANSGATMAQSQ